MYYEYESPFPPFPVLVLGATTMVLVLILATIFLAPLLEKLAKWWSETVDRWWDRRQARREGR